MRLLPMGLAAVLVDGLDVAPATFADAVRHHVGVAVVDVVPGARTVLVTVRREDDLPAVVDRLRQLEVDRSDPASTGDAVEIPVSYDGPDLVEVATTIGRSVDEVVELHSGASYRVEFCGFAPGFGYLSGLPGELHLPRRSTPRTRVPAGSVAIASTYSAVYPTASPGGWHLIGTTSRVMFDADRDPPATLGPGTTVRFRPA